MGMNLAQKIISEHLVSGEMKPGEEIGIRIDQVLLQDATGTMAAMEFEMLGLDRIRVPFAIVYIDHNMLQIDYRNPDDHRFLRTFAARYGLHYSRPGNGICHQVHTERFAQPGLTLLGADSHTTTGGAVGSLAIGAGGMEVAVAMGGYPYEMPMPKIVGVWLEGQLSPWVTPKDVILEMLRRLTVSGGLNKIYEFRGPGVATIPVTGRATICNMILELGATAGIFPSDERTREFLALQQREHQWKPLGPDPDATYDEEMVIDLSSIEPLIAKPHSPDNVVPVREVAGTPVAQVCIGSSVNSWYEDLAIPAAILKGQRLPPGLVMTVSPGSRQILDTIAATSVLRTLIQAGARLLEPACGPCVGMGQAPPSGAVSVRTFNRNFKGRSGTIDDLVYLCSPATAGATALRGVITDPRELGEAPVIGEYRPVVDDSFIDPPPPPEEAQRIEVVRGPNIKPPPPPQPLPEALEGHVLTVLGDNISTGSMAPDGAIVMADRSNLEAMSAFVFMKEDPEFVRRARQLGGGFVVAGNNYGQGSSREHAVLAPKFLGVKAVLAKSFARIHRRNLIALGLVPLLISDELYGRARIGDTWRLPDLRAALQEGRTEIPVETPEGRFVVRHDLSPRERAIVLAGGVLNYLRGQEAVAAR